MGRQWCCQEKSLRSPDKQRRDDLSYKTLTCTRWEQRASKDRRYETKKQIPRAPYPQHA